MKPQPVVGRVVLNNEGVRVIQPVSNIEHRKQVLSYQKDQAEFMRIAGIFVKSPSPEAYGLLQKAYQRLKAY